MDPISALSIVSSLAAFSTSSLLLVQNFVKSAETLGKLQQEVVILQHVLEECQQIIVAYSTMPMSIAISLSLCNERQHDLLTILGRVMSSKTKRLTRAFLYTFKEHEIISVYNSFRDSVLLLRDLSSE
jgi:hypothetical protein